MSTWTKSRSELATLAKTHDKSDPVMIAKRAELRALKLEDHIRAGSRRGAADVRRAQAADCRTAIGGQLMAPPEKGRPGAVINAGPTTITTQLASLRQTARYAHLIAGLSGRGDQLAAS